ncbi:MAG TPA: hypothetical protein ENH15_05045, partial [Actinobacteria bacterium]|nr:hypothetical protein [Actinomycetota bacterium]
MRESSELRRSLLRPAILVATILLTWAALFIGQQFDAPDLSANQISPETYRAPRDFFLIDQEATDIAKQAAADDVEPIFDRDPSVDAIVLQDIDAVFQQARDATLVANSTPLPVVTTSTIVPEETADETTTTSSVPEGEGQDDTTSTTVDQVTTTTTIPVDRTASVIGRLYIDMDDDGEFSETDFGLPGVRVTVYDAMGTESFAISVRDGTFLVTGIAPGPAEVLVNTETAPERLQVDVEDLLQTVNIVSEVSTEIAPIGFRAVIAPVDEQVLVIPSSFSPETRDLLIQLASADVVRAILGEELWLDQLENVVIVLRSA